MTASTSGPSPRLTARGEYAVILHPEQPPHRRYALTHVPTGAQSWYRYSIDAVRVMQTLLGGRS